MPLKLTSSQSRVILDKQQKGPNDHIKQYSKYDDDDDDDDDDKKGIPHEVLELDSDLWAVAVKYLHKLYVISIFLNVLMLNKSILSASYLHLLIY